MHIGLFTNWQVEIDRLWFVDGFGDYVVDVKILSTAKKRKSG